MLKLICARKALVMRMRLAISWDPWGSDDEIELLIILFNLMDTVRLGVPVLPFEKDKLVINLFSVRAVFK